VDASWDKTLHQNQGNLGLADGSAHQVTDVLTEKQIIAALQGTWNINAAGNSATIILQFPN
jgi:hypothetical protein